MTLTLAEEAKLDSLLYYSAEQSLSDFIRIGWPYIDPADYIENWHIDALSEHLEAVANGEIRRLIINVPPRHMKSLSTSVAFPAWVWAQRKRSKLTGPQVGFLSMSYAQSLSVRDNVKCRRLIDSPWYQAGWGNRFKLTTDQNTKIRFENDCGGYRLASSVDGSGTGEGGDIIVIDDAVSAADALSPVVREAANEWFDNTMSTRLNDPKTGAYVMVMQRLHQSDLVGHVLERQPDEWTVLCLPARYEHDHPHVYIGDKRTTDGELLWPARVDEAEIVKLERALGSYGAAGQLQQRPAPREGGMFKRSWFSIVPAAPAGLSMVRGWDLAGTVAIKGSDPDWTVGVKLGKSIDGFIYILDVVRFRGSPAEVERTILNTAQQDTKTCAIQLPQDPGQAGKAQAGTLTRLLSGFNVHTERPTGPKEVRAAPFAAQCEVGNVKLVDGPWINAFFDEIELFPYGNHDDQVDAAADAFNAVSDPCGSSGFLQMVREDNHQKQVNIEQRKIDAAIAAAGSCPYPPGSVEHSTFFGLN